MPGRLPRFLARTACASLFLWAAGAAVLSAEYNSGNLADPYSRERSVPERPGQRGVQVPSPGNYDWIPEAVIYEIDPAAFSRSGKLTGLEGELHALHRLGATCLFLTPVQPQGQAHPQGAARSPYAVRDYSTVSLQLGTKEILKTLVQDAHLEGLKVILDWPAAATAWDHPFMKEHPDWYRRDASSAVIACGEAGEELACLDYGNGGLRRFMLATLTQWAADYDLDGFRLHGSALVPMDFWKEARRALSRVNPRLFLLSGPGPAPEAGAFDVAASTDFYSALARAARGAADAGQVREAYEREERGLPAGTRGLLYLEDSALPRAAQILGPAQFPGAALALTLDGVPLLYNGQEIGETRRVSLSAPEPIDWKAGERQFRRTRKFYRKLLAFRAQHPSIQRGQLFEVRTSSAAQVWAFARSYREDAVLVAVNLSPRDFDGTIELPEICVSQKGDLKTKALFDGPDLSLKGSLTAAIKLPPWGYQVWKVK